MLAARSRFFELLLVVAVWCLATSTASGDAKSVRCVAHGAVCAITSCWSDAMSSITLIAAQLSTATGLHETSHSSSLLFDCSLVRIEAKTRCTSANATSESLDEADAIDATARLDGLTVSCTAASAMLDALQRTER